ncbi:MAG TPA: ribonuclease III [Candidatus Eisenbergiella intestinipullorum]|nr:ribonuclease III [Candidatus Eisenbergiella intestinipullorum]
MEESLTLLQLIRRDFGLGEVDLRTLSPLTLAFVGDCVYDLILRTVIVERHNASPNQLHREKSRLAKAPSQAEMAEALQEELTQEELAVYRRGRNAKSHTTAKNASVLDYRKATGLEALYGWLYLSGQEERLLQLIRLSLNRLGWKL